MRQILPLAAVFVLLLLFFPAAGKAQSGQPVWSQPQNISNMPTKSSYPQVVAGPDGVVHVFWTENLPEYASFNNIIYYARLDSNGWSQPVDILISPQGLGGMADYPTPLLGRDGRLHVVFSGGWGGQIYYASADAGSALDAHAWSAPVLLSQDITGASYPNILNDVQGNIHLIFQAEQGSQQGLYHSQSHDDGLTWTNLTRIPGTPLGTDTILADTRAAISPLGTIHVTWMWTSMDLFPPKGIFYVRSDDLGATWSEVETVIDGPYRYPDVAVSGEGDVVMVWSGTSDDRFKYYRSSDDGGIRWSSNIRIPTLGGLQGYAGMAVDSAGKLHLGMVASCFELPNNGATFSGDALVYSVWEGNSFSTAEPLLANTIRENNLQYADIVISEGNIVHLVAMYPIHLQESGADQQSDAPYQYEIFYVQGMLDAPRTPPVAASSDEEAVVEPTASVPTPESIRESRPVTFAAEDLTAQQADRTSLPEITPTVAFLIGAVPALVLLVLFITVRAWNRQRE